jgi:hypothetical protein
MTLPDIVESRNIVNEKQCQDGFEQISWLREKFSVSC